MRDPSEGGEILASELFMELASELRCSILMSVSKKPAKLSSLARELDSTVQDIHRNVNRLTDTGLTRREDGSLHLTEYGRIVTKQIPYFIFMKKHANFFESHTLGDIPEKFLQRIGALQNCELVHSVTAVMERLKKLESGTKKQLRLMSSQAWAEEGRIIIELSMHGIEVLIMVGKNTIFPKEIMDSIGRSIEKMPANQKMQTKMVEKVDVALYISDEQQAAVMFPSMRGEIDMGAIFIGSDPAFYEWCNDLFDHYWERGGYFDVRKTTVV
jgi:predicted transcriptional regulator